LLAGVRLPHNSFMSPSPCETTLPEKREVVTAILRSQGFIMFKGVISLLSICVIEIDFNEFSLS
jgi:hypothetical protein